MFIRRHAASGELTLQKWFRLLYWWQKIFSYSELSETAGK